MKSSKIRRPSSFLAEILTIILFVLFLFPFFLVLINSAKTSFEVTQYPLAWPKKWETIVDNIIKIWTSESVCYPSSLLSSAIITAVSLILINVFSAMAGWALVRTKNKVSSFILFIFVASLV
ncbi:MAG: carbohydrate ABC transporter permease, partial [Rectinema sp.]